MNPSPTPSRSQRHPRGGFALIVTLSLMTMLLLMVLTLTTLVRINLQSANTNLNVTLARQNAILGAYVGLGMLQKFAGPDQRVTTAADIGRINDQFDLSTAIPSGYLAAYGIPIRPFGTSDAKGATRYWTMVWGHNSPPMNIYSTPPKPVLLTYLVSGNENTPLYANVGGTGEIKQSPDYISYTADTQSIRSKLQMARLPSQWSPMTYDLVIAGNTTSPTSSQEQPATVLAGVNSVGQQNINLTTAPGGPAINILQSVNEQVNYIVVPLVNVTIPSDANAGVNANTVGRYAFWVRDEGIKAKYTPSDPYAGKVLASSGGTLQNMQMARYRMMAPQRFGLERMAGFGISGTNNNPSSSAYGFAFVNSPITYCGTSVTRLSQMQERLQVMLVDGNLTQANPNQPTAYLQQHFHDYTTYSWGVLADTLRGGLRFDLTSAFEPGAAGSSPFAVFSNTTFGLGTGGAAPGKNIFPTGNSPAVASTEPNTGSPVILGPRTLSETTTTGLRWDRLRSFYQISGNVATYLASPSSAATGFVPIQAGSPTQMAITPIILQARVQFGIWSNTAQQPSVAVQAAFVLANPYNFPIRAPNSSTGGLDIGFRISTDTKWEWALNFAMRDDDRRGSNHSNTVFPLSNKSQGNLTNIMSGFLFGGGVPSHDNTNGQGGYGWGLGSNGYGYAPILNNKISPLYNGNKPGGNKFNSGTPVVNTNQRPSILDGIAFHIAAKDTFLQPGEARVYSLGIPNDTMVSAKNVSDGFGTNRSKIAAIGASIPWQAGASLPAAAQANFLTYNGTGDVDSGTTIVAYIGLPSNEPAADNSGKGALQVQQVPLTPGWHDRTYFLREIGTATDYSSIQQGRSSGSSADGTLVSDDWVKLNSQSLPQSVSGSFPSPQWGWFTTMYPSVACTVEMRVNNGNYASPVGTNVTTRLINLDLTGAGLAMDANLNTVNNMVAVKDNSYGAPFLSPMSDYQGGRKAYSANGMPGYIGAYYTMMAFPGSARYDQYRNRGPDTDADAPIAFYPSGAVSFRNFSDYNLRATNMALPPFIPFNVPSVLTANTTTAISGNFMNVPPYARFFDQGGYDGGELPLPPGYVPGFNFGQNLSGNSSWDVGQVAWGFSDNSKSASGTKIGNNYVSGQVGDKYVVLYNFPTRTSPTITLLTDPVTNKNTVPDVPIMSIGQLSSADVTADDVWLSVGYQPGVAIGNSFFSPYVNRQFSVQSGNDRKNVSALIPTASFSNTTIAPTGSTNQQANSYDISYLINIALWDHYFFSTLYWGPGFPPGGGANTLAVPPANTRLKFAAAWPTNSQLGSGAATVMVKDPVTGNNIFKAYAPARYLMIDGPFNINSTSVEAWKSVLSAMRNVAYNGQTPSANGGTAFPRVLVSPGMTVNGVVGGTTNHTPITPSSGTAGMDDVSYAGFRQLTDYDIDVLAVKIVQQVRLRGPFMSLAQFVNRSLYPDASAPDPRAVSGPLQAAINRSVDTGGTPLPAQNILTGASTSISGGGAITATYSALWKPTNLTIYPNAQPIFDANPGNGNSTNMMSRVNGIPAWLTQADILSAIGAILSARSDTFVIRSYGDVLNPLIDQSDVATSITNDPSKILSRAWCEMVVQRFPDYMDPSNDATATAGAVNNTAVTVAASSNAGTGGIPNPSSTTLANTGGTFINASFGRRFKIVSLRWLDPSDI